MCIPTPHINAKTKDEIAPVVLMPGDPLRAEFIAENFLENVTCFNKVRNMLGFTGTYKGQKVSVMGSGMGMPSMGIYSYELYNFYGVEKIIRIGTAGSISLDVNVRDIILAMGACTNSNFAHHYELPGTFAPIASWDLLHKTYQTAEKLGLKCTVGNILSIDVFYSQNSKQAIPAWSKMGALALDMEAAALYMNAAQAKKEALCILTVSDSVLTGESLPAEQRQTSFTDMMKLALETIG